MLYVAQLLQYLRHDTELPTLSQISFEAKAPPGYTFIPAGNPQFTSACKEMCRKDGLKVFAVTVRGCEAYIFSSLSQAFNLFL